MATEVKKNNRPRPAQGKAAQSRPAQAKPVRRRRKAGVPTALVIALLVLALAMGGMLGFAIARNTDPSRAELQAANQRIMELENILTFAGYSEQEAGAEDWIFSDDQLSVADELGGFDDGVTDLWSEDSLLSGTLSEDIAPVVVAEFNGGQLLSSEVIPVYNDYLTTRIFSGEDANDISGSLLMEVMAEMASDRIIAADAQARGLTEITEADQRAIEAQAAETFRDLQEYYTAFVTREGMTAEEIDAAAAEYMKTESGITLESLIEDTKSMWWQQKYFDVVVKDVTVTDEEVQDYYQELLSEQKSNFESAPEEFEYAHMNGDPILYRPAGYRAVRDVLIAFDSDGDVAEAIDLSNQLAMATDEAEIASLNEQLNALYAPLEAKAQEAVEKLNAGASFESLMDEYGCDDLLRGEPMRSEGYYITDDSDLNSEEYVQGAMMIEQPGQVSTPLRSPYGVHLVQYIGDITPGETPLSEVQDAVRAAALEVKREEYYENYRQSVLENADVKYYPERLQ